MLSRIKRCAIETEDWLRYHPAVRGVMSRCKAISARLAPAGDDQQLVRAIVKLCTAARWAGDPATVRAIQCRIRQCVARLAPQRVDWAEFVKHFDNPYVHRGVLLKPWVSPREKGVLFIAFEGEWFKLLRHGDLKAFCERYDLVIAPSSSPHNLVNYVFPTFFPGPLFTLISNESDLEVLPRIADNFVTLPLYASSWVNPDLFEPLPLDQRDVDLVMVASFGKVKRHHALFTALRRMPAHLRILLVGQDQDGRNAESLLAEARCYGVADRFEVQSNLGYRGVIRALCRAKTSLILSRREGSCVVVAEALFANTPVAILRGAEIGSRAFINEQTGRFLDEGDLAGQLVEFIKHCADYQPRRWAEHRISCYRSTQILNDHLKDYALDHGKEWTRDLVPLCWRPDPMLAHSEDAGPLQEARDDVRKRFGLDVGPRLATGTGGLHLASLPMNANG